MTLFNKLQKPVFLKESGSAERQLEQLQAIDRSRLPEELQSQLDKEIKLVSLGIQGEKSIEFELRNSHIPMYILHDLYLEDDGLTAQIDYLVITRRRTFVIECKNLYGNIEINANGDFIRTVFFGNRPQKEGIYSPITQNQRHMDMIRLIRGREKSAITKALFEKYFLENYRSVIVLANPKTILNDKYAKKEVKSQVIRADAFIAHIKQINAEDAADLSDKNLRERAEFFLNAHIEREIDYAEKYISQYITTDTPQPACEEPAPSDSNTASEQAVLCPRCGAEMILRTAKKGENVGKQFWGCSSFPKCRGTIALENR